MAEPRQPAPVKPIVAILWARAASRDRARLAIESALGPTDLVSESWPFDATDYYSTEMGSELWREFWAFEPLASPAELAAWKRETNALEAELQREARTAGRVVNLDPGYVHHAHVALASTKPYSHRIYIQDGIYAEVTLLWQQGEFTVLPWTFPEYRTERVQAFLARVRERYSSQRRAEAPCERG